MVRVGLFGNFEGADAVVVAVLRAELAARLPALELHVYTPSGTSTAIGQTECVRWTDQALGAPSALRRGELAAALDAGGLSRAGGLRAPPAAPPRTVVGGPGPFGS